MKKEIRNYILTRCLILLAVFLVAFFTIFGIFFSLASASPALIGIDASNTTAMVYFTEPVTGTGYWKINDLIGKFIGGGARSVSVLSSDTMSYTIPYGNYTFKYYLSVPATDVNNSSVIFDETADIINPAPSASTTSQQGSGDIGITTPMPGQIIKSNVIITGTATMENIKNVKVGYTFTAEQDCSKVSSWVKVSDTNGGWAFNWAIEELNLASGMYFVYAKATDTSGNYICAGGVLVYVKEIKNVTDVTQETVVTIKTLMCDGELCSEPEVGQEIGFVFEKQTVWRLYLDENVVQEGSEGGDAGGSYTIASGGKYSLRTGSNYFPIKNFTVIGAKATTKAKDYVDLFNVTCYPACTKQVIQVENKYAYICPLGTNISCYFNEEVYFRVVRLSDGGLEPVPKIIGTSLSFTPKNGDVYELLASKTLDTGYKSFRQFEIVAYENPFFNFWAFVFYGVITILGSTWYMMHTPIILIELKQPYITGGYELVEVKGAMEAILTTSGSLGSISVFSTGWLLQKIGRAGKNRHFINTNRVHNTTTPAVGWRGFLGLYRDTFTLGGNPPLMMSGPTPYWDPIQNRTFQESYYGNNDVEIKNLQDDVAAARTRDMNTKEEEIRKDRISSTDASGGAVDASKKLREEVFRELEEIKKRLEGAKED